MHLGHSGGGQQAEAAGGQPLAGRDQQRAALDVFAAPTHVLARLRDVQEPGFLGTVRLDACVFLHHDGVGAPGQRRAGEKAHAMAGSNLAGKDFAGGSLSDDAQADGGLGPGGGQVGGAHGVAVHGGIVEGRQVNGRAGALNQHARVSGAQRNGLRHRRWNRRQDAHQGRFVFEHEEKAIR